MDYGDVAVDTFSIVDALSLEMKTGFERQTKTEWICVLRLKWFDWCWKLRIYYFQPLNPLQRNANAHIRQVNRMNCVKTNIVSLHVINVVFALDTSIAKTLEDVGNKNGAERFSFHSTDFDEGTTTTNTSQVE